MKSGRSFPRAVALHRNLGPGLLEKLNLGYLLNFGEGLMRAITRTINGSLKSEPLCLGASVREKIIEPTAGGNAE